MTWQRLQSLRTRLFWLKLLTLAPASVLHVALAPEKRDMARRTAGNNPKSITDLAAANVQSLLESTGEVSHGRAPLPEIGSMSPAEAEPSRIQAKGVFLHFAAITLLGRGGSIVASSMAGGRDAAYADRPWVRQDLPPEVWREAEESILRTAVDTHGFSDVFEGGVIRTESVPGLGSTFHVTPPLPPGQAAPQPGPTSPSSTPDRPTKLHILLAEDSPVNVKVAAAYLARRGHVFAVAENGREALALLSARPFDVVLMDVEMPEIDGLETTRRLRAGQAGPTNRSIPVIAMTAHAPSGVMERCLSAGMTGYLPKPLDFQALDAMLECVAAGGLAAPPPADSDLVLELDTEKALRRLGGDAELLRELQADFLRLYPRKLRLITLCSGNENWDEAALAAHSLKNIAGAVGAESSRLQAGRLEDCLRRADAEAANEALAALQEHLSRAGEAIKAQPAANDDAPDPERSG